MLRRIGALNFLDHLKYGALTVTLPLYLISRGIDVGEIGLILSLLPLAFLLMRVVSSVFADVVGVKPFFVANTVFHTITNVIFLVAKTPLQFGIGKISEGVTGAFFWAVDRTAIMARTHVKKYLSMMSAVRAFAGAVGLIGAGLLIEYVSFESVFLGLIGLGVVGILVSLTLRNRGATMHKLDWKSLLKAGRKQKDFWQVAIANMMLNMPFLLLFTFLLPVMMDIELGMDYLEIAVMLTAFYASIGLGGLLSAKLNLDEDKLLIFQMLMIPMIVLLPVSGTYFTIVLALAGFGLGVCFGINEGMVGYFLEKGKGMSSRIATLFVPYNVAAFVVLAGAGFALDAFGSEPLFVFCSILLAGFVFLARKITNDYEGKKGVMDYRPHKGIPQTHIRE